MHKAPAGPPATLLVGRAARLTRLSDATWELSGRQGGGAAQLYVDPLGAVGRIEAWARDCLGHVRAPRYRGRSNPPLVLSGLVMSGKTYTQQVVVPAVVASVLERDDTHATLASTFTILRLRGDFLIRESGYEPMLRHLLRILVIWAFENNVPVEQRAWECAVGYTATGQEDAASVITRFFRAVEVPVLVLFDEVQSFLLPRRDGTLDKPGARFVRDALFKQLLVHSPPNVLWCITGGSMAQVWTGIASLPPHGYALMTHVSEVTLPAACSSEHMDLVWEYQQSWYAPIRKLDPLLRGMSDPSPALLTTLVEDWVAAGRSDDGVAAFVGDFVGVNLFGASRKEWALLEWALPTACLPSQQQLLAVYNMSLVTVGSSVDVELHRGLRRFLEPHLTTSADGLRCYLSDAHQRQIVQMTIARDGTLKTGWAGSLTCRASCTQLEGGFLLQRMGEVADFLFGAGAHRRPIGVMPPGADGFRAMLEALADDVGKALAGVPPKASAVHTGEALARSMGKAEIEARWEAPLQTVLSYKCNSGDRLWYAENKGELATDFGMLVFYLRLGRNVLAHQKPWGSGSMQPVDLGVVMALPTLLRTDFVGFVDRLAKGLWLLMPGTIADATAAWCGSSSSGGSSSSSNSSSSDSSSSNSSSSGGPAADTSVRGARSRAGGRRRGGAAGGGSSSRGRKALLACVSADDLGPVSSWAVCHRRPMPLHCARAGPCPGGAVASTTQLLRAVPSTPHLLRTGRAPLLQPRLLRVAF